MNKSFLLGCVASVAFASTVAFAGETAESVKTAFTEFLTTQTQIGDVLDLSQITVTPDGNDFVVTLPAVNNEEVQIEARDVRLTEAGEFNGYPQYKIESIFEVVQGMFQNMIPDGQFTTQSLDTNMVWVPHYNLVVNLSQNIKGLNIGMPGLFTLTVDSLISDTLVQTVSADQMNKADSQDATGVLIAAEGMQISLPTVSYNDRILNSTITGDPMTQTVSASYASSDVSIPTLMVMEEGNSDPIATAAFDATASLEEGEGYLEMHLSNIVLGQTLRMLMPSAFVPTDISVDLELSGVTPEEVQKVVTVINDDNANHEEAEALLRDFVSKAVINVDPLEVKGQEAGVAVTGTIATHFREDNTSYPVVNAKVVITNLDKLSPEPTVNQEQCEQTKKQMENVADKIVAENAIQNACAPHGGFLDEFRPFLNPENRVINSDGTTTDTIDLIYDNEVLTLNGHVVE